MKGKIILIISLIVTYILLLGLFTALLLSYNIEQPLFFNLATAIITSWVVTVILFYIWAIYYYHIQVPDDNQQIEILKAEGLEPESVSPRELYPDQTMGLPAGTIRGTIALSLLVAGLSLLIASFDMKETYEANKLFIDNFEFIKTAFLMVIAFYFGQKSLAALSGSNRGVYRPRNQNNQNDYFDDGAYGSNNQGSYNNEQPDNNYYTKRDDNRKDDHPVLISSNEAGTVKNLLRSHNSVETIDDGDTSDFEDGDAQG